MAKKRKRVTFKTTEHVVRSYTVTVPSDFSEGDLVFADDDTLFRLAEEGVLEVFDGQEEYLPGSMRKAP